MIYDTFGTKCEEQMATKHKRTNLCNTLIFEGVISKIDFEQNSRYGYVLSVGIPTDPPLSENIDIFKGGICTKSKTERRLRRAFLHRVFIH